MTIFLASGNAHKLEEIHGVLPGVKVLTPADAGLVFNFEETGHTFLDNSMGKAMALWHQVGLPVLADDSGLCVDALGGRPGVLSARYGSREGGPLLDSPDRNALLLREMSGVESRSCRFVCCLSLVLGPDRAFSIQETCEGVLLDAPRGTGGFGYDPVVYLPELGKSVAELSPAEKNQVSHRGKALQRLRAIIADLLASGA
ncbi:MAG: RdgB/HAM1 family non-canonical purine NTP pyrophosphatase [Clostridia bacterium]|jgi:XTP/dITP diphosphohydrolase|nr:RdgB/HAM1 family non-canonical purine NTP pyrophosphatase [Spirochaetia bacterium]